MRTPISRRLEPWGFWVQALALLVMSLAWSACNGPWWAWWLFGASIAIANGAGRLSARFLDRDKR